MPLEVHTLDLFPDLSLSFVGPSLHAGPLPALFYFALSAHESLNVDPFNQPVAYLSALPMRIFSIDIISHGPGLSSLEALNRWAESLARGENLIVSYIDTVCRVIEELTAQSIILPDKTAVAGLSRGSFIAAHVAARLPHIRWILGFAPLTKIQFGKDFHAIRDLSIIHTLDLERLKNFLHNRSLRFYIGNCDERVNTRSCFDCIEAYTYTAREKQIRSPAIELIIFPSVGFQGHGTPKAIFHQGAQWIAEQLGVVDVL